MKWLHDVAERKLTLSSILSKWRMTIERVYWRCRLRKWPTLPNSATDIQTLRWTTRSTILNLPRLDSRQWLISPWSGRQILSATWSVRGIGTDYDRETLISLLAPFYPGKRDEGWWLVIGEHKTNSLLAIKHISLQQKKKVSLELVPQKVGFCLNFVASLS